MFLTKPCTRTSIELMFISRNQIIKLRKGTIQSEKFQKIFKAHDSFIWNNSNIKNGIIDSWLLGDSGYALQSWLMRPITKKKRD